MRNGRRGRRGSRRRVKLAGAPEPIARCPDQKCNGRGAQVWPRIAILAAFLASVYLLYRTGVFHFFVDRTRLLAFLGSLGPLAFAGFIALQALQVIAAPIPGDVTGLLGGFLYGPALGVLLSTVGLTAGSFINFWLSRTFGRPFVDRFVNRETIARYDYLLHHKGAFLVFLVFLIPGAPKDLLCYVLGLGHLSTREFLLISTVGRFGGTVLLTLGGSFLRRQQYYSFYTLLVATLVVVFLSMAYRDKLEALLRRLHLPLGSESAAVSPTRIGGDGNS